ncbi:MAG TPA: 50S ribosomal protein L4 [Dehalococcoidia bacterium]|nr:50S ribosomal protein L4 [Dehalococcoidia bacterium]
MELTVYNSTGKEIDKIEVNDAVFGIQPNETVVHQALLRQLANARQGTADTKTRSEVTGSSRKMYRQKHTGMARAGSRRSPLRRGGGIIFGPHARSYRQAMPKKMRRLALRSILSNKVSEGELKVVDSFGLEEPKTSQMKQALKALGVTSSALLVTAEVNKNVIKSSCNITKVKTTTADTLNVADLLSHNMLLMTVDAVRRVESLWGKKEVVAGAESS